MYRENKVGVVIAAGGVGKRTGQDVPKQFLLLKSTGKSVLEESVSKFVSGNPSNFVDKVVVTSPEGYEERTEREVLHLAKHGMINVVRGGERRQDSVGNALDRLKTEGFRENDIVLIHDAARPFANEDLIERVLVDTYKCNAAIAAIPVSDTVRDLSKGTLDRSKLCSVQTPEGFRFGLIREAIRAAADHGFTGTDDGGLVERIGTMPVVTEGDYSNIKITTGKDLELIVIDETSTDDKSSTSEEDICHGQGQRKAKRDASGVQERGQNMTESIRIGHGFDVHRLVNDRELVLLGVKIPYEKGLLGHSDADAPAHALMDAMLGAAAMGDIGHLFPDSDEKYEGADSMELMREVAGMLQKRGYVVVNVDITIICERPKLAGYIEEMRDNIAGSLSAAKGSINVKATTTEGLGYTGRGEGIACEAVCIIKKIKNV